MTLVSSILKLVAEMNNTSNVPTSYGQDAQDQEGGRTL